MSLLLLISLPHCLGAPTSRIRAPLSERSTGHTSHLPDQAAPAGAPVVIENTHVAVSISYLPFERKGPAFPSTFRMMNEGPRTRSSFLRFWFPISPIFELTRTPKPVSNPTLLLRRFLPAKSFQWRLIPRLSRRTLLCCSRRGSSRGQAVSERSLRKKKSEKGRLREE